MGFFSLNKMVQRGIAFAAWFVTVGALVLAPPRTGIDNLDVAIIITTPFAVWIAVYLLLGRKVKWFQEPKTSVKETASKTTKRVAMIMGLMTLALIVAIAVDYFL